MTGAQRHGGGDAPRLRCFVATFLSRASARRIQALARERLDDALIGSPAARPVPLPNYHVTLKFLGDVEIPRLADACAAVEALAGYPVTASATGLRGFPRSRAARLVAAELAGHEALESWWAALQERFGGERRPFRPHVTLVRLHRPRTVPRMALAEPVAVELAAPRLYRSDQGPDGVRYRPVDGG